MRENKKQPWFVEYWDLIKILTTSNLKARYRNSALGMLWSIIEPLAMTFVFVFLVTIISSQAQSHYYTVMVFLGMVIWTFFAESCVRSSQAILGGGSLIQKIYFPREILVFSAVLSALIQMGISLTVLAVMLAFYGILPSVLMCLLLVIIAIEFLMAFGSGLILAALTSKVHDIGYALPLVMRLGMFATPAIYFTSTVTFSEGSVFGAIYNGITMVNPLNWLVSSSQGLSFLGTFPSPLALLYPLLIGIGMLVLGYVVFKWRERYFGEEF